MTFLPNNPVCFYTKNSQKVNFSTRPIFYKISIKSHYSHGFFGVIFSKQNRVQKLFFLKRRLLYRLEIYMKSPPTKFIKCNIFMRGAGEISTEIVEKPNILQRQCSQNVTCQFVVYIPFFAIFRIIIDTFYYKNIA